MPRKTPLPYTYRYVNNSPAYQAGDNLFCTKHIFSFYTKDRIVNGKAIKKDRYIVEIEEYQYNVCAVKFYRQKDKSKGNINKYRVMTQKGCAFRILSTALIIMLDYLKRNPFSSYVFYGVANDDENEKETKRYIVYRRLVLNYIGVETFERFEWKDRSYMLLLNKHNPEPELLRKIEAMFAQGYHLDNR